jgi:glycosyltransferase involved in cell wall biosynthesis
MKYSVIIPVYNVEQQLHRCLDSVAAQNRDDLEVILVDDGSTDGSGSICDEYAKKYDYFRLIHQDNKGLSGARNTGLEFAQGEWILFLDADDYWSDDFMDVIDNTLQIHPSDYYKFNYEKVFDNREPIKKALIVENDDVDISNAENKLVFLTEKVLVYSIGWEAHTGVYKKSIIDGADLRFTDTQKVFAEDMLFTMEYILHANSVYLICNFLYMYYTREGSLSVNADIGTILPRLFNLLHIFESDIEKCKILKKNFFRIYFHIINFHVKYNLKDIDIETLINQINELNKLKYYDRFNKLIKKDNALMGHVMYGRNWL